MKGAVPGPTMALVLSLLLAGCTSFTSVRSAEVRPGGRVDASLTLATPPGDGAAWFWTWDCSARCDRAILSPGVAFTYGTRPEGGGVPYELGAGLSGTYPIVHGYVQLRDGDRPLGVGAQIGVSWRWREDALFLRYDVPVAPHRRLALVSTAFRHSGNSPNGMNPGTFTAFIQGVGLEGPEPFIPFVAVVLGRTERTSYNHQETSEGTVFVVLGANLTVWRRPGAGSR